MNQPSGPTTVVLKVAYIDDEPSSIGTVTEPKVPSVSSYMIVILAKPATLRESVTLSLSLGFPSKSTVGDTDYYTPIAVIMMATFIVSFDADNNLNRCVSAAVGAESVSAASQHVVEARAIDALHAGAWANTPDGSLAGWMLQ